MFYSAWNLLVTSVSLLVQTYHGLKNIISISAKANSLLGMIRRSISFDAPSPVKFQLYVSHVRSILEYCSPLWSPANVEYIVLLERVQRHATKYMLNNYSYMSYAERCIQLSILPLCFRREIIDLVLFYIIIIFSMYMFVCIYIYICIHVSTLHKAK